MPRWHFNTAAHVMRLNLTNNWGGIRAHTHSRNGKSDGSRAVNLGQGFDSGSASSEWNSSLYVMMRVAWEEAWHLNSLISTLGRYPKWRSKSQSDQWGIGLGDPFLTTFLCSSIICKSFCTFLLAALLLIAIKDRLWKLEIILEPYETLFVRRKKRIWIIGSLYGLAAHDVFVTHCPWKTGLVYFTLCKTSDVLTEMYSFFFFLEIILFSKQM